MRQVFHYNNASGQGLRPDGQPARTKSRDHVSAGACSPVCCRGPCPRARARTMPPRLSLPERGGRGVSSCSPPPCPRCIPEGRDGPAVLNPKAGVSVWRRAPRCPAAHRCTGRKIRTFATIRHPLDRFIAAVYHQWFEKSTFKDDGKLPDDGDLMAMVSGARAPPARCPSFFVWPSHAMMMEPPIISPSGTVLAAFSHARKPRARSSRPTKANGIAHVRAATGASAVLPRGRQRRATGRAHTLNRGSLCCCACVYRPMFYRARYSLGHPRQSDLGTSAGGLRR